MCKPRPVPSALFQIRRGYRTEWNGLAISVEHDSSDWMLRVEDSGKSETLYTARRLQVSDAQMAAADFAIFRVLGGNSEVTPDRLAKAWNWQEYC